MNNIWNKVKNIINGNYSEKTYTLEEFEIFKNMYSTGKISKIPQKVLNNQDFILYILQKNVKISIDKLDKNIILTAINKGVTNSELKYINFSVEMQNDRELIMAMINSPKNDYNLWYNFFPKEIKKDKNIVLAMIKSHKDYCLKYTELLDVIKEDKKIALAMIRNPKRHQITYDELPAILQEDKDIVLTMIKKSNDFRLDYTAFPEIIKEDKEIVLAMINSKKYFKLNYNEFPQNIKEDKEIILKMINANKYFELDYKNFPQKIKEDKEILLTMIEYGSSIDESLLLMKYSEFPEKIQKDREIILAMINSYSDYKCLWYPDFHDTLKSDGDIISNLAYREGDFGLNYSLIPEIIKRDKDTMEDIILSNCCGHLDFEEFSFNLKCDKEFVEFYLNESKYDLKKYDIGVYDKLQLKFKKDYDIQKLILEIDPSEIAFENLHKDLKNDVEIIKKLLEANCYVPKEYIPEDIKNNKKDWKKFILNNTYITLDYIDSEYKEKLNFMLNYIKNKPIRYSSISPKLQKAKQLINVFFEKRYLEIEKLFFEYYEEIIMSSDKTKDIAQIKRIQSIKNKKQDKEIKILLNKDDGVVEYIKFYYNKNRGNIKYNELISKFQLDKEIVEKFLKLNYEINYSDLPNELKQDKEIILQFMQKETYNKELKQLLNECKKVLNKKISNEDKLERIKEIYEYNKEILLAQIKEIHNIDFEKLPDTLKEDKEIVKFFSKLSGKFNSNMSGMEFEQYCKVLLEENGFNNVVVTKISKDFGADIIAIKDNIRYAIQCKRYSNQVGISSVQEVIASKSIYNCHVAVVLTNSTFTDEAITLANKNNVLLWDKNKFKVMQKKRFS